MPQRYKVGDYGRYNKSPRKKQERALRNKNRRAALRTGTVRKGDGKQIDHIDGNHVNNVPENIQTLWKCCHAKKGLIQGNFLREQQKRYK